MRLLLATLIAVVLALVAPAGALAAPVVTTGPATGVGPAAATLTGTVDPDGEATAYRFEYGTSTAYGSQTPEQTTPDDPDAEPGADLPVSAAVEQLTPGTTYHFRLVAGDVAGADRIFTTIAAPAITRLASVERTPTSARLTARINPKRAATTYHVEWGTSASFGRRTPDVALPAGARGVPVSVALDGLSPYRRIHWRVVAANAAGETRSGTAAFTTLRAPTGVTLSAPPVAIWNAGVSIGGRVEGRGINGISVVLEEATFPFGAPFAPVALARANSRGDFRFPVRTALAATRFRAVTRSQVSAGSPEITMLVRPRVTLTPARKRRRSLHLGGTVQPGLPAGAATLERRTRRGGWAAVARQPLRPVDATRSTYDFLVRRARRARVYRVAIAAAAGGALLDATSREQLVGKRRRRPAARRPSPPERTRSRPAAEP